MTLKKKNKAVKHLRVFQNFTFYGLIFFVLLAVLNITRTIYLYITRDKTFIHKKI